MEGQEKDEDAKRHTELTPMARRQVLNAGAGRQGLQDSFTVQKVRKGCRGEISSPQWPTKLSARFQSRGQELAFKDRKHKGSSTI